MNKNFILTSYASSSAIGFVLGQLDDDNKEHVIAFGGRSLSPFEKKLDSFLKRFGTLYHSVS